MRRRPVSHQPSPCTAAAAAITLPSPPRATPPLKPQSRRRRRQARASRRSRSRRRARTSSAPTTSRAHIHSAPSSRAAPAGLAPAVALQPQPQRSRSHRHHAPRRHSNHRADGADAKRERVVAAAAAAERAPQARPPRAERTSIALRARVRRRPVSHQPSPCSRSRSDHAPIATTAPRRHSNHRADGADAKRERVVAAAAAAERAPQARPPRAERTSIALRARVRRRPVSHQPSPCSRSRSDHAPIATTRHAATQTTEPTAPTPSASESSQPQPPPSAHLKRAHHEPSAHP